MKKFIFTISLAILFFSGLSLKTLGQSNVVYYFPFPAQDLYNSFKTITDAGGATISGPLKSTISMVSSENGNVIYYDQWEDGYETNLTSPVQASTKIYGDGNPANGDASSFCPDCAGDIIHAGSILTLKNDIPMPRNPAVFLFDGRDKIATARYVSVSMACYPSTPGTVLADATEVTDTSAFDLEFYSPIGTNMVTGVDNDMFNLCQMYIMAAMNGTSVQIDADANGTFETTINLNQGESYKIPSVNVNAHILANKPIECDLFTSRPGSGSNYENRWFTLYPSNLWDNSYYCPITTTDAGDPASVFLFNPSSSALTIFYTTQTGSGSIVVPAKSTVRYDVPSGTGVHFYTALMSQKFFALGAMDTDLGNNSTHDWGMTLLPETYLTTSLLVGYGPGSSDGTQDGNPVWVIATAPTTIYVDYDGDPTTGPLTDPNGYKCNVSYNLAAYESKRIFDLTDKDQTGMRIYTVDGTRIAAAWGQDPASSGCCAPYLDEGTTISPDLRLVIAKEGVISYDANGNHLVDAGDSITYTVKLENFSLRARNVVTIVDAPSAYVTYISGSAKQKITYLASGNTVTTNIPNNANPTTIFPFDEGGFDVGDLLGATKVELTYKVVANFNVTTQSFVTNFITVTTQQGETFVTNKSIPVNHGFAACSMDFTDNSWAPVTSYNLNSSVYVSLTASYMNQNTLVAETLPVVVSNTTTGETENLTLTESGVNTGIFRASLPTSTSAGGSNNDGTLKAVVGDNISVIYNNVDYSNTCSDNATVTIPSLGKQLYLSDSLVAQGMDRIIPWDGTAAQTAVQSVSYSTIAVDTKATNTATEANGSGLAITSCSTAITTGAGTNRLMIAGISYEDDNTQAWNIDSVVQIVGGVRKKFTFVKKQMSTVEAGCEIWRLVNPTSGAGTVTAYINSGTADDDAVTVGVITFTGVDQTTPLGTAASNLGTTSPATVVVTSAVNEMVFGVLGYDDSRPVVSDAAQTQQWNLTAGGPVGNGSTAVACTKAGAASVTCRWTSTTDDTWAACGVSIKQAAIPAVTTFTQTPSMCSNLDIPNGGTISATLYLTIASGAMPANPNITAVVKYGATVIANLGGASYAGGILTLSGATTSAVSIPAGQAVVLEITSNVPAATFRIDFDSQTKPSKLDLPTTTVISVNSIAVYDAPYPGGSIITSAFNGSTAYVRSVVSDPFGNYDITSMPIAITGPSSYTLNANASSVATSGCTRTYEYVWATPTIEGNFSIVGTAKEGKENTISDSKSTNFILKQSDLGTPCASGFTNATWAPVTTYAANGTIYVQVIDADQNLNSGSPDNFTITINAVPNGDIETLTLTESGNATGIFRGSITSNAAANSAGVVYAPAGTVLHLLYTDPNDAADVCNSNASIPLPAPDPNGLVITKTRTSSPIANIGDQVTYSITVTNVGNQNITQLTLTDTYPSADLLFVSSSVTPTSSVAGTLTWTGLVPITVGQTKTIDLVFTAQAPLNPVTNTATTTNGLYSGGGTLNNQTASANVNITNPDYSIVKTLIVPASGQACLNTNIQFQIVITNTGNTNITSLPMSDTYSNYGMTYVSASPLPTGVGGGMIFWSNLASTPITPGNSVTITIDLTAANYCGSQINTATVIGATDVNGDALPDKTADATVIVDDLSLPIIVTCPPNVNVNVDPGSCSATGVSIGTITPSDNCGITNISNDAPASFPVGTTTVTWSATDAKGNTSTCTQTVTVTDNINPTITCAVPLASYNTDPGHCYYAVPDNSLNPTSTWDNCGIASVINNFNGTSTLNGAHFPIGTTTVIWTITDIHGNSASCQYNIVVAGISAPIVGTITQPTCALATGSVNLSGLPNGSWTINPGSIAGNTNATTLSGLSSGTHNYTVTLAEGCTSIASANVVINAQPSPPTAATASTTIQPTCALATGTIVVTAPLGAYEYNIDGGVYQASVTFAGLSAGSHTILVRSTADNSCISGPTSVTVNAQPSPPSAATASTTIQPTCALATGTIVVTAPLGAYEYNIDGGVYQASVTFTGVSAGSHNILVRRTADNSCISGPTSVTVNAQPATPSSPIVGSIAQPTCLLHNGSVDLGGLPAGNWILNPGSINGNTGGTTVSGLAPGMYNFTVTDASGCISGPSSNVVIIAIPNCVPVAVNDVNSTNEDTPVSGSVTGNDTPSGDGGNTWSLIGANGGASNGTVTMDALGNYTYTPNANYNGSDVFTYHLCDVDNDCSTATVTITIIPVNDLPIAVNDVNSTNEDTPVSGSV
ncbi:MAG: Ig-like domain-containing protein, partial [Bacteroidota bacterium]